MPNVLVYQPNPGYPNLHDAGQLADYLDTVLYALAALRSGSLILDGSRDKATLSALYTCINDVDTRLTPRLDGLRDALIRAHRAAGGSYNELALAMDAPRPTAQSRVRAVTEHAPTHWEQWATNDLNPHMPRRPMTLHAGDAESDSAARDVSDPDADVAADDAAGALARLRAVVDAFDGDPFPASEFSGAQLLREVNRARDFLFAQVSRTEATR